MAMIPAESAGSYVDRIERERNTLLQFFLTLGFASIEERGKLSRLEFKDSKGRYNIVFDMSDVNRSRGEGVLHKILGDLHRVIEELKDENAVLKTDWKRREETIDVRSADLRRTNEDLAASLVERGNELDKTRKRLELVEKTALGLASMITWQQGFRGIPAELVEVINSYMDTVKE